MYFTIEDTFPIMKERMPLLGSLLEFGIFNGNSLNRLIKGAESVEKNFDQVYGFDSFSGLPKETESVWHNPEWPEGAFNVQADYNLKSVHEAMEFVRGRVERKDIVLIPGFFEDSLTYDVGDGLSGTCSYLHVDCDIHKSTRQVLDFVFTYDILQRDAIVRFDDWLYNTSQGGNNLAFQQSTIKYGVEWEKVADNVYIYQGLLSENFLLSET